MKEKSWRSKILLVEKRKLLKDVKFKEKEIFKIKKEITHVKQEAKGGVDTLNMKLIDLNGKVQDLTSQLSNKAVLVSAL